MRPCHKQQARQVVEEHIAHPRRHAVSARRLEVPVDDDHRDEDRDDVHDEREEQVLGDESEQNRDAHGHLLAGVGRQVEDADAEERDEDAWNDEVDRVEERLTTQLKFERDLRLVTTFRLVVRVL